MAGGQRAYVFGVDCFKLLLLFLSSFSCAVSLLFLLVLESLLFIAKGFQKIESFEVIYSIETVSFR